MLKGCLALPTPKYPDTLLAQHERGIFAEARSLIRDGGKNDPVFFNRFILPRCEELVMGVGYRMAYEAAMDAGVDPILTNLYIASAVRADEGWYVENLGHSRKYQYAEEEEALETALPLLDRWIAELEVDDYVRAPIVSDEAWERFFNGLEIVAPNEDGESYVSANSLNSCITRNTCRRTTSRL